jgi:broad specificity phosphatase PhoE
MKSFLLIRHGEKVPGAEDRGLTGLGRAQASKLGDALRPWHPQLLYASTYNRAVETATIIAKATGLEIKKSESLIERQVFPPPGGGTPEFKAEWAKTDNSRDYSAFGGESSREAGARLANSLLHMASKSNAARIAVVTHGGIIRDLFISVAEQRNDYTNLPRSFPASEVPLCSASGLTLHGDEFAISFFALAGARLREALASARD